MNEWKEKLIFISIGFVASVTFLAYLLVFQLYQEFTVHTVMFAFLFVPLTITMFLDTLINSKRRKNYEGA